MSRLFNKSYTTRPIRFGNEDVLVPGRLGFVLILGAMLAVAMCVRLVLLTISDHQFLLSQGNLRSKRIEILPAHRGMLLDREGRAMAVSVPRPTLWMDSQRAHLTPTQMATLAHILGLTRHRLAQKLARHPRYAVLARRLSKEKASRVLALHLSGVYTKTEYLRRYPSGAAAAPLLGITDHHDQGQEGLELRYNALLQGQPGKREVWYDRLGDVIRMGQVLRVPEDGHDVRLSVDRELQDFAYQSLAEQIKRDGAQSGSLIVLNPKTGEVLAAVNYPSFDPHHMTAADRSHMRNRAWTDVFEPGSTIKAFVVAHALMHEDMRPDDAVDTYGGMIHLGHHLVQDVHTHKRSLTVSEILERSSNVGAALLALKLPVADLLAVYEAFGLGHRTPSGFPGELPGYVPVGKRLDPFMIATLAFGYGLNVTHIQLARAYGIIANDGIDPGVTLLKNPSSSEVGHGKRRVIPVATARALRDMLTRVTSMHGTGWRARVPGVPVAGKTGTAYMLGDHGYDHQQYRSSFVGMVPADHPQLVISVVINRPDLKHHFGNRAAGPLFAQIAREYLPRLWAH